MFSPARGASWYLYLGGALLAALLVTVALSFVPPRFRRPLILTITFIGGLFFVLEFFLPTSEVIVDGQPREGNILTPLVVPFGNIFPVITGWATGLGLINLFQLHGKRVLRGARGSFDSAVFFVALISTITVALLNKHRPSELTENLNKLFIEGAYQSLDATMFSIIAFFIVSAAYRAFRVRSAEATLLLVTAVLVMLGQIILGQMLTSWLPGDGPLSAFRVEVIRDWILTRANTPATRAIQFGLGVGSLAVALRIWLGLERGSYFDSQG